MRTKAELYQIILNRFLNKRNFDSKYLCNVIEYEVFWENLITKGEYKLIMEDFKANKPNENLHSEFMVEGLWHGGNAWWKIDYYENGKSTEIRIKFLEKMILINS